MHAKFKMNRRFKIAAPNHFEGAVTECVSWLLLKLHLMVSVVWTQIGPQFLCVQ